MIESKIMPSIMHFYGDRCVFRYCPVLRLAHLFCVVCFEWNCEIRQQLTVLATCMWPTGLQLYLVRPTSSIGRRSGLRSADTPYVDVPKTRPLLGDGAFSVAGPRAWNSLPLDVRSAQSMLTFRKRLKSHLFQRAYQ
jgi:hypothetical protein